MHHQPWFPCTASHSESWNSTWTGDIHKIFLFTMIWRVTRFLSPNHIIIRILLQPGNVENYFVTHLKREWLARWKACCQFFLCSRTLFCSNLSPCSLNFLSQNSNKSKTHRHKQEVPNMMKNPHRKSTNTVYLYCHNIHLLLLKQQHENLLTNAYVTCSKAQFNLIKFTLAIPTTVFNYPIYSDCISCHVFLYTPQVPASLFVQAVSSCHNL